MKTAIVTDTNSNISVQMGREMGVHVIPMPFVLDGANFLEGTTCTHAEFFRRLKAGAQVSTSQPAPEEILSLWDKLLQDHDAILHFPMTSGLSNSCQTAQALAQDYGGRVQVVDNHRIAPTLRRSIQNAKVLLAQGKDAREIRRILEAEQDEAIIYIAVNTLEHLKRSGRVTAAGAALGAVLHIKPVLQIRGGKLDAFKKVRGMAQAKKTMLQALENDLAGRFAGQTMAVYAGYTGADPALGEAWLQEVQAAFPDYKVELVSLPLSICCHTGEGALGVACAKKEN